MNSAKVRYTCFEASSSQIFCFPSCNILSRPFPPGSCVIEKVLVKMYQGKFSASEAKHDQLDFSKWHGLHEYFFKKNMFLPVIYFWYPHSKFCTQVSFDDSVNFGISWSFSIHFPVIFQVFHSQDHKLFFFKDLLFTVSCVAWLFPKFTLYLCQRKRHSAHLRHRKY